MIGWFPVSWQARWWKLRRKTKIEAIRDLRRTAKIPLRDAKEILDPLFDGVQRERCPTCGRVK